MEYFITDLKNKIDFFLRNLLKISRKNYAEKNESKDNIFTSIEAKNREKFLFDKYDLENFKNNSTVENYLENLYKLDLLDSYLSINSKDEISLLDIGCKNCSYANALHHFFKTYSKKFSFTGIEIDFNRLYSNLFSRYEVAKFYTKDLPYVKLISGNLLNHNETYDYITWFLPFVFDYPHLKWGLPLRYFSPEKLLSHAYSLLNDNGVIFVINQGFEEYTQQKDMYKKLSVPYTDIGEIESCFAKFEFVYYLTLVKK